MCLLHMPRFHAIIISILALIVKLIINLVGMAINWIAYTSANVYQIVVKHNYNM